MRPFWMLMMVVVVGCAAEAPVQKISAEQHAANVAAAERAGYKTVAKGDRTLFCPTASPTGSHMSPTCITESDFEAMMGTRHATAPSETLQHQSPGPGPGTGH